jgi:GT2 family glycosyltransferase
MSPEPFCSVVVPTYARPGLLARCLDALALLDYPHERFEVIVVDDGGELPRSLVASFASRLDLTLLRQARAGPAAARNAGIARARGRLLAFTDDDCRPAPSWLGRLAAAHCEQPEAMLGGQTVVVVTSGLLSIASQVVVDAGRVHADRTGAPGFFTSNNLAVPAESLRALGSFDPAFVRAEDRDLCDRWAKQGLPLVFVPKALVRHGSAFTSRRFLAQHFANGRSVHRFHRAHAGRGGGRIRPAPGYYLTLLRLAYTRGTGLRGAELAALVALAQVANYSGYAVERWGGRAA